MLFSNIQNLIENAVSTVDFDGLTPICESHITPDASGLGQIVLESVREDNRLEEAIAEAEHQLLVCESTAGISGERMSQLQEAVIGDVFSKITQGFKDLYQKIVGFFKKLFASLSVMSGDVKKSLDNAEKYLNKDLSEYSYTGFKWKSGGGVSIANTLSVKLESKISIIEESVKARLVTAKAISNNTREADSVEREDNPSDRISDLIGSTVNTLEEAKKIVIDSYLEIPNPEVITGLTVGDKDKMFTFMKTFEKNKVLTELRNKTIKSYQKVVTLAETSQKDIVSVKDKYKTENKTDEQNTKASKNFNVVVANIKTYLMQIKSDLSIYNTLMGECITLEKKKFGDYKKIISGAVRYTPKKEK